MRFSQIDRITDLRPGHSIVAIRGLSLCEQYLKDHFPRFPVMPGVLMLESLFQASMWLVRVTDEFQNSVVALRESKSIKFQGFVQPGDQLQVTALIKSRHESLTTLKVAGSINGVTAVSGRLIVDSYNLVDRNLAGCETDDYMRHEFRLTYRRLCNQLEHVKTPGVA